MNPLVTVVVPHHLNDNDEYLKCCIDSILASSYVDLEIICISDAITKPSVIPSARVQLVWDPGLYNVTRKWHCGVKMANASSKYVMLISDDVMVSRYCIAEMANTIQDQAMILSPASNCDATTRYHTEYMVGWGMGEASLKIPHKCTLQDIKGFERLILEYRPEQRILIDTGWISFYCTMFPKTVLKAVGDFDEKLDVRYNDVDYCHRARLLGIPSLINLGAFALHFGDRTLPKSTRPEEYAAADEAYRAKYSAAIEDAERN